MVFRCIRLAAIVCVSFALSCAATHESGFGTASPPESGIAAGRLDPQWERSSLQQAGTELQQAFAHEGAEGLLRLRLRDGEIRALYNDEGARRVAMFATGLSPAPGEQRWNLFRRFVNSPVIGFCARGVHVAEPNGPDGFKHQGLVVDRLLIVGSEPGGFWGAWIEGLVFTTNGWRLLPTVPFARQVETPRRDHADVQLWDCDLGVRPDGGSLPPSN